MNVAVKKPQRQKVEDVNFFCASYPNNSYYIERINKRE